MRFEALCVYCRAGQLPELNMSILMYVILGSATGIKILLFIYCFALKNQSGASPCVCCLQKSCLAFQ